MKKRLIAIVMAAVTMFALVIPVGAVNADTSSYTKKSVAISKDPDLCAITYDWSDTFEYLDSDSIDSYGWYFKVPGATKYETLASEMFAFVTDTTRYVFADGAYYFKVCANVKDEAGNTTKYWSKTRKCTIKNWGKTTYSFETRKEYAANSVANYLLLALGISAGNKSIEEVEDALNNSAYKYNEVLDEDTATFQLYHPDLAKIKRTATGTTISWSYKKLTEDQLAEMIDTCNYGTSYYTGEDMSKGTVKKDITENANATVAYLAKLAGATGDAEYGIKSATLKVVITDNSIAYTISVKD